MCSKYDKIIKGDIMYFDNLLFNILLVLFIIICSFVLYLILNKHASLLSKYSSKNNLNCLELVNEFNKYNKTDIKLYPSSASSDLDIYMKDDQSIFVNSRHYYSDSIYSLSRVLYLCCYSKVQDLKMFNLFEKSIFLLNLIEVLGFGFGFVGLLLKNNILIIIGLSIIVLSFIIVFINYRFNKRIYEEASFFIDKLISKESAVFKVIYKFEMIKFLFRPILSLVKLFPFLMCEHDKKMIVEDK